MRLSHQPDAFLQRHAFVLSDDPERLDMEWVIEHLQMMPWRKGKSVDALRRAIIGSFAYGIYAPEGKPAGFIRVISDGALFAWVGDFFVLPEYRGRGIGRWVFSTLLFESRFQAVPNWQLSTTDAQGFYKRFGFEVFQGQGVFMNMSRPP